MTALYWRDFDCTPETRAIEHASTEHIHCRTDAEAAAAFLAAFGEWHPSLAYDGAGQHALTSQRVAAGRLYACVRGPGGLVRGVEDRP